MTLLRRGLHLAAVTSLASDPRALFDRIGAAAEAAEAAGFDAVFVPDHVHQNALGGGPSTPMFEAYTLLGAVAARTNRVRLGALVSAVTLRNPAFLTKSVTSLDVIAGGRAVLGLGAGWDEAEHAAYGIAFPPLRARMDLLEQTLQICRAMFRSEPASFEGPDLRIRDAYNAPRPIAGDVPILVGGGGERRTLALVARFADACNVMARDPRDVEAIRGKLDVLARHCDAVGRDPATITKTANIILPPADPKELGEIAASYVAAGFDGVVVFAAAPDVDTIGSWGEALSEAVG